MGKVVLGSLLSLRNLGLFCPLGHHRLPWRFCIPLAGKANVWRTVRGRAVKERNVLQIRAGDAFITCAHRKLHHKAPLSCTGCWEM
jgi:hypothetical protein